MLGVWEFLGSQKCKEIRWLLLPSEAFQAPILFERGAGGPNLGPPDFSKEKYKGPTAPLSEKKCENSNENANQNNSNKPAVISSKSSELDKSITSN